MAITVGRGVRDTNFSTTVALPSGAGTSLSTAFDLVGGTLSENTSFPETVTAELVIPADTALVSAATRVYKLFNDSVSTPTAAVPGYSYTVTGTAGNGAAATIRWKLPASLLRYLSVQITGGTSGSGDSTALSATFRLLF